MRCFILILMSLTLFFNCRTTSKDASTTKVWSGQDVVDPQDPVFLSTAAIVVPGGEKWLRCSATVISPYHLVTAAHCFAQKTDRRLTVGFAPDPRNGPQYEIMAVAYPDDYYSRALGLTDRVLDIAIVMVDRPIVAPYKPIAIAGSSHLDEQTKFIQAGFGFQDPKKYDYSPTNIGRLQKLENAQFMPEKGSSPIQQITVTNGLTSSTLGGDSGGPLLVVTESLTLQGALTGGGVRITRNPDNSIRQDEISLYADLSYFRTWLQCATKASTHPLRLDTSTVAPKQITCTEQDRMIPMVDLAQHNERLCQRWPGWKLIVDETEIEKIVCWPGTKEACEVFKEESGQFAEWDEEKQKCLPM